MNMSSLHRRDFLSQMATGLGGIALASLLPDCSLAAPAAAHFPPKAKRVIQLFMNGGASQCDLFDYKPELIARHGKPFDPGGGQRVEASISTPGSLLKSPYTWAKHGQSGRYVRTCHSTWTTWRF
jgi:hypothetical protein